MNGLRVSIDVKYKFKKTYRWWFIVKNVLFCCSSFYPSYKSGGPVRSLCNLVELLGDSISIDVITKDRDMGDKVAFSDVNLNSWLNHYHKAKIFYLSPEYKFIANVGNVFKRRQYDIIYLNSFFDSKFSIRFLLLTLLRQIKATKIIIAPRGELTNGAMSIKPIKKKVYLRLFKIFGLHKRVTFHFTSKQEQFEGLSMLGDVRTKLVPNMHEKAPSYCKKEKEVGSLNMIFLSRVSPKKNLMTIIRSLMEIKTGRINFIIAGAFDDKLYWNECKLKIDSLSENIEVLVLGSLDRKQVSVELNRSHVFFLPTLNENYGHAIVEAMMHSNIVMLSDQTPWSDVANHGGFIAKAHDISLYAENIKKLMILNEKEYNAITQNVYSYCNSILDNNVSQIKKMFD